MSELWDTLTTGLVLSLVFIAISYLFWKRFDKPTPLMIERQEERERLKEERDTWRQVEAQMQAEKEEAERREADEKRRQEALARSQVPTEAKVTEAWKSLGVSPSKPKRFEAKGEDANAALRPLDQSDIGEKITGDEDVLSAPALAQVRQDKGVQPGAEEPDWELIEKLEEIAGKDDIVVPDVPEAPDLDAAATLSPKKAVASDVPVASKDVSDPNLDETENLFPAVSSEKE